MRAIDARCGSGFTATGKPTASSIGRSEDESAYATRFAGVEVPVTAHVDEYPGPSLGRRRDVGQLTGQDLDAPVVDPGAEPGADDLVEQREQGFDDDLQGARDQHRVVAELTVPADPSHRLGERPGQEQVAEVLDGIGRQLLDRRILVAPIERAQEVGAVLAVLGRAGPGASASVRSTNRTLS